MRRSVTFSLSGARGGLGALLRPLLRRRLHRLLPVGRHRRETGASEEAGHAIGGDGALADPVGDPLGLQTHAVVMLGRQHGVVAAQLLDEAAVARAAAVGDDNMVIRPLLGSGAGKANLE